MATEHASEGRRRQVRSLAVRRAAARVVVEASRKTGHPVDPRIQALADSPDEFPTADNLGRPVRSLAVRRAAARVVVEASRKTGHPVDPRIQKLADAE